MVTRDRVFGATAPGLAAGRALVETVRTGLRNYRPWIPRRRPFAERLVDVDVGRR
jgi:hypothetical protein